MLAAAGRYSQDMSKTCSGSLFWPKWSRVYLEFFAVLNCSFSAIVLALQRFFVNFPKINFVTQTANWSRVFSALHLPLLLLLFGERTKI